MMKIKLLLMIVTVLALAAGGVNALPLTVRTYDGADEDLTTTLHGGEAYYYGFEVIPSDPSVDLDGVASSVGDFHPLNQPDFDTVNGLATDIGGQGAEHLLRTDFGGSLWRAQFLDAYYTIEAKINILGTGDEGTDGAVGLFQGSNLGRLDLRIGSSIVKGNGAELAAGLDNVGWHTWRIARDTDGFWVWRDGGLLNSEAIAPGGNWDRSFAGDYSGALSGDWEMEYYVLDKSGAYNPVPEPLTLTLLGIGGVITLRRRNNK